MMIYRCNKCRYIFEGKGYVTSCPDCGAREHEIRIATKEEQAEYRMYQEEFNMEMQNQTA